MTFLLLTMEMLKMRMCMIDCYYQKKYGYPYINCLDFSRIELQEMFLKSFRWEGLPDTVGQKNEIDSYRYQKTFRYLLWIERMSEIMGIELEYL